MSKPPVYIEENCVPHEDLLNQLKGAIVALEDAMKANVPIKKGDRVVGYGVCKSKKAIVCDNVTSIIREIKSKRAW